MLPSIPEKSTRADQPAERRSGRSLRSDVPSSSDDQKLGPRFRFYFWIALAVASAVMAAVGCTSNSTAEDGRLNSGLQGRLRLSGSSTLAPLVAEAAKRFEEQHPGTRIDVQTGGSSRGIRDTRLGIVNLGMASRDLKEEERDSLVQKVVAWDGVAFVIHADNPITSLNKQQLRDIYLGKVDRWSDLGGRDAPLVVANRAQGRSELDLISRYLELGIADFQTDIIDGETQQSIKTITTNPNAIGYTSIGAAQHAIARGERLKLLPLDGVAASTDHVQTGRYPVARPLLILIKHDATGKQSSAAKAPSLQAAFGDYLLSDAIDDITISLGYVPPQRAPRSQVATVARHQDQIERE